MPLSQVNPKHYSRQLANKVEHLSQQFSDLNHPAIDVFESPPLNFRMRAEFRVWHEGDECFYVMFKKDDPKTPCRIDDFPIGSLLITQLMPQLMQDINQSDVLKQRLFQMEFLTTLSNQALVTLIYHKPLDEQWQKIAEDLQKKYNINIIGRSKKQKLVLTQDFVIEQLTVNNRNYAFQQTENSFTQPNAIINQTMLTWALEHTSGNGSDLLELYCGNGNFTAILAQNFNKVLCTEISKTSVKSAKYNFQQNNIDNVEVVRMSSEEFTTALNREREFRRLKDIDLDSYQFSTILIDPPRAGLDQDTEKLVSRFDNIIYVSCNPNTLHENLQQISKTHNIEKFAAFDQFPYTHHIECGVILKKR